MVSISGNVRNPTRPEPVTVLSYGTGLINRLLRHIFAIAVLPVTVVILVPLWIARRYDVTVTIPNSAAAIGAAVAGVGFLVLGVVLFVGSLKRFASEGQGTLAPWDPPRRLVVRGPYRYVRNPMITGVLFVLIAEALLLRSWPHARWAATFLVINLIYIPLLEEPILESRFGDEYRQYRMHVPRLIPRARPWPRNGDSSGARR
jgi:protein-S-isoprenylcysteine O-methyltransferase Ste14